MHQLIPEPKTAFKSLYLPRHSPEYHNEIVSLTPRPLTLPRSQVLGGQSSTYQVLPGHLAYAHHADGVGGDGLVVERRVHEGTRAGGRSLEGLGRHRVVRLQQRLRSEKAVTTNQM